MENGNTGMEDYYRGRNYFERLVEMSGLSPIFANHSLRRACKRANLDPDTLKKAEFPKIVPEIEKVLSLYLTSEEVKYRIRIMQSIE
jgi:hypothetical protein